MKRITKEKEKETMRRREEALPLVLTIVLAIMSFAQNSAAMKYSEHGTKIRSNLVSLARNVKKNQIE